MGVHRDSRELLWAEYLCPPNPCVEILPLSDAVRRWGLWEVIGLWRAGTAVGTQPDAKVAPSLNHEVPGVLPGPESTPKPLNAQATVHPPEPPGQGNL